MEEHNVLQSALDWWNSLPMQDIHDGRNGWANLVMIYYPERTDCQGLTDDQILYIYEQERKQVVLYSKAWKGYLIRDTPKESTWHPDKVKAIKYNRSEAEVLVRGRIPHVFIESV